MPSSIFDVSVAVVSKILNEYPENLDPETKLTAVASPRARPTPRIALEKIPDFALLNTTLKFF